MFAHAGKWFTAAAATLLIAGCGGDGRGETSFDDGTEPEPSTESSPEQVIEQWSQALAAGQVEEAAAYFRVPSIVQNGPTLEIRSVQDAIEFNESLPCGAELLETTTDGEVTSATFELVERPGPGECGSGSGEKASTAFVIEDGLIVEWRRIGVGEERGPPPAVS